MKIRWVGTGALALVLTGCGGAAMQSHPSPTPTVTKTVIKVVNHPVPGPTHIVKVPGPTVYRNGYQYIYQDPAWACAGSLWNAYVRLARGGPAGDPSIWQALCPDVPQPAS